MRKTILVSLTGNGNDTIFLSMPTTPNSQYLENLKIKIEEAVFQVHHRLISRNRKLQKITSRLHELQVAKVVIAVCSPLDEIEMSDPDVMYELGIAQSIGKSTLVLSNNIDIVPLSIIDQDILIYDDDLVNENEFFDELIQRLQSSINAVENGLTDSAYEYIKVVQPRHWFHLQPDLWDSFSLILNFAKKVHHFVQTLETQHLRYLKEKVDLIIFGPEINNDPDKVSLKSMIPSLWTIYIDYYSDHKEEILQLSGNDYRNIEHSFSILRNQLSQLIEQNEIDISSNSLEKSYEFYIKIKEKLDNYDIQHDETNEIICAEDYDMDIWDKEKGGRCSLQINNLLASISLISTIADSMILNLVNLLIS